VRRELERWRLRAAAIPDPVLGRQALAAIDQKGLNVEAIAVFATLAPRRRRAAAIRAMAALQVAVDYLDNVTEEPVDEPLANALALHRALSAAVTPGAAPQDWYRLHPRREDGGYLDALVATCQEELATLPATAAVASTLRRAAARCGEGQSYTHAGGEQAALEAWAATLGAPPFYRWWEAAAGASSSAGAQALIAAAADSGTSAAEAELIECAYFPPVGALTVLLDDLIDRDDDALVGAPNYLAYYDGAEEAADRLELITHLGVSALAPLRHRHRHAAILTGVAGFYLSAATAEAAYARPARRRLLAAAGPLVRPIVAVMRQRRARKRPEGAGGTSGL